MFNLINKFKLLSMGVAISNATEEDVHTVEKLPTPKMAEEIEASLNASHAYINKVRLEKKVDKKDHNSNFLEEYFELFQILDFGTAPIAKDDIEESYKYHSTAFIYIKDDLEKISSLDDIQNMELPITKNFCSLNYNDFRKIALANTISAILSIIIKNHLKKDYSIANEVPNLGATLDNCTGISKRDGVHIIIDKEDARKIEKIIAENMDVLYPDIVKKIHQFYEQNKAPTSMSTKPLSDYQFYCILDGIKSIPHANYASINQDIKKQNNFYNYATKIVLDPTDKNIYNEKMKDLTGRSSTSSQNQIKSLKEQEIDVDILLETDSKLKNPFKPKS